MLLLWCSYIICLCLPPGGSKVIVSVAVVDDGVHVGLVHATATSLGVRVLCIGPTSPKGQIPILPFRKCGAIIKDSWTSLGTEEHGLVNVSLDIVCLEQSSAQSTVSPIQFIDEYYILYTKFE